MAASMAGSTSNAINITGNPVDSYPFTIAVWVSLASTGVDGSFSDTWANVGGSGNNSGINLGFSSSTGKFLADVFPSGGGTVSEVQLQTASANTWYPIIYVGRSATDRSLYVSNSANVANDATSIVLGNEATNVSLGLFRSSDGTSKFSPLNGKIAHVAHWNAAVSPAEINAYCYGSLPGTIRSKSLVGWWPLDGYGHPALDLSVFKRNGVLSGTVSLATGPPLVSGLWRDQPEVLLIATPVAGKTLMGQIWM
jgi:hypothetical protein